MHTESTVLIQAPLQRVFDVTSDLARWPALLPHYRYVDFLEKRADGGIIKMAAMRDFIPISWVSDLRVDRDKKQIHFRHLRAFTKGMEVIWLYEPEADGTRVRIVHDLRFRIPPLAPVAELIIGGFFIENIAGKTLASFQRHLENSP